MKSPTLRDVPGVLVGALMVGFLLISLGHFSWGIEAHSQTPSPLVEEPTVYSIAGPVSRAIPASVHILKDRRIQGSGVILTSDGVVMTARHITGGTVGEYEVTLNSGDVLGVKYVVEDLENDLAFLKLDIEYPIPSVVLSRDVPRVGDRVFIVGSPLGFKNFNTVSSGIVSAEGVDLRKRGWEPARDYNWVCMIQTDSSAYPGVSGGGVFNLRGEVIGVLVGGEYSDLNWSVPVARMRESLEVIRGKLEGARFKVVEEVNKEFCYD